jgi:hypothetical protein
MDAKKKGEKREGGNAAAAAPFDKMTPKRELTSTALPNYGI